MERTIVQQEETAVRSHLRKRDPHDHGHTNGHGAHNHDHKHEDHDNIKQTHPLKKSGSFLSRDYDLLHWNHLPEMFKHNPWILNHYRPHLDSWTAFKSIFHLHNETWNIWSHLLGFFIFVYLLVDGIAFLNTTGDFGDRLWFAIHLVAAQIMLLSSVIYHTLSCNTGICAHVAKLDYSGISTMITGSIYFPLYYIFHCEPTLFLFYISIISLLGGYSIYFCWRTHNVGDAGFEGTRVALFIGLSFFGTFPLVHGYWLNGAEFMAPIMWRLGLMGFTYIAGAMIYLHKAPERFFPGKFDLHLNSHVIWHFFVLAAALVHYYNHFFMYEYRTQHNACPAVPSYAASDDIFHPLIFTPVNKDVLKGLIEECTSLRAYLPES